MGRLTDGGEFGRRSDLAEGEIRTIIGRDRDGNQVKQGDLVRTDRPYVYDLADCYNQDCPSGSKRWFVDFGGNLRFDDPPARPRPEILPKAA